MGRVTFRLLHHGEGEALTNTTRGGCRSGHYTMGMVIYEVSHRIFILKRFLNTLTSISNLPNIFLNCSVVWHNWEHRALAEVQRGLVNATCTKRLREPVINGTLD